MLTKSQVQELIYTIEIAGRFANEAILIEQIGNDLYCTVFYLNNEINAALEPKATQKEALTQLEAFLNNEGFKMRVL